MAKKKQELKKPAKQFLIVGIGASAGGAEAFKSFIRAIPENSGMAYIFVQHLHPNFESNLTAIMQRETNIPVVEITNNVKVEADHIYIIPSNKLLTAVDGVLKLKPRPAKQASSRPIDLFFSSLAEVHQSHVIGIVLSGLGSDGTVGLKKIKDNGGISFAQEMMSAEFDSMPQHAINAGVVDFVMVPERMPQQLLEFNKTLQQIAFGESLLSAGIVQEEENFRQVLALLRVRRGADFTYYKQSTIRRRILRRMIINKIETLRDYLQQLINSKVEQDILYQDLLIPVTSFFRDGSTFEYLSSDVLPELLKTKSASNPLRVWVAGCSTGEEAYSIAICLHEFLGDKIGVLKVQVFATDISDRAIDKARKAVYSSREIEGISEQRLKEYFHKTDGHYHVKKEIRDICVFAVHNFLNDPPFARIDLVSCRNVLIYMEGYLQKKALTTFHYALNEKGMLLLGKSETVGHATELFVPQGKTEKLYRRKPAITRFTSFRSEIKNLKPPDFDSKAPTEKKKNDFQQNADDVLLAKFSPPGVVVNEQFDIVQFRGSTGDFLEPTPGKASLNILKMLREGMAFEVRNALHKAKLTGGSISKENIQVKNGELIVHIEVIPLLNTIEPYYLILFSHDEKHLEGDGKGPKRSGKKTNAKKSKEEMHIQQLEKDLAQLREDMRSITEDQEAANEELQSANEELLSGSEELQSLNEELETSKEELQSTNEELMTINQELFDRSEQYNQARLYTETIVKTIHEPLLVLNRDLRIKSANQSFYKHFNLLEEQISGRVLFELQDGRWDLPDLRQPLLKIQSGKLQFIETEVLFPFHHLGERSFTVHAQVFESPTSEQMLLLVFDDVTLRNKEIQSLKQTAAQTKNDLQVMQDFFIQAPGAFCIFKGKEHVFQFANPRYEALFGVNKVTGKSFSKVITKTSLSGDIQRLDDVYKTGEAYMGKEVPRSVIHNGVAETIYLDISFQALRDESGTISGVLAFYYDVTEKILRRQQSELQAEDLEKEIFARTSDLNNANTELRHSNRNLEQFASIASHDLQEPLRKVQTFATILLQKHKEGFNDEGKELLEKIDLAAKRMSALVKDVLNYSKITKPATAFVPTDLNAILQNILQDFDLLIKEKNAVISNSELPVIEAIPLQMNQLFYNLLSNSLKFAKDDGECLITISSREINSTELSSYPSLDPSLQYVELAFKDNGIGFDPEFSEQVFLIFQRLNDTQKYSGTGIGLALCQNIAFTHHGTIWAAGSPGVGASFHLILPLQQGGH